MGNKQAYFDYLTRRLDSGESKNVVIATAVDVIRRQLEQKNKVVVLDVGCFSGAMLNRICQELPTATRKGVIWVGIDNDKEAMQHGAEKYGIVTYTEANLEQKLPLVKQYDVIILCNVLHELFPDDDLVVRKSKIGGKYKQIADLLVERGVLILLDGIRPDDSDDEIEVELVNSEWGDNFERLVGEYKAAKLSGERISAKEIKTNKFTLAVFLTKARYLGKEYWDSEAKQLYQYFTAHDFEDMVKTAEMQLERIEPQHLEQDKVREMIEDISIGVELPAKNILVVAKKIGTSN